jgi:hypothetical protein
MKQMTCAQMGGPATCSTVITGNSPDEMIANGMQHLAAAHPDMAASVNAAPKDGPMMTKWSEDFQKNWNATPDSQ